MNRFGFVLLICAILVLPSYLYSQNKPPITLYDMTRNNGTNETFSITEQAASKVPEWNPSKTDTPPLSLSKAVSIAKQWMKKNRPKENKPDLESVKIERIHWPELNNRWYYLIELNRVLKGFDNAGVPSEITLSDPAFVVVLMDGTTVDPMITKRSLR